MPTVESEYSHAVTPTDTVDELRALAVTPEDHADVDAIQKEIKDAEDQALSDLYEMAGDDPEQIAEVNKLRDARAARQAEVATTKIPRFAIGETGVVMTPSEAATITSGDKKEYGQGGSRA